MVVRAGGCLGKGDVSLGHGQGPRESGYALSPTTSRMRPHADCFASACAFVPCFKISVKQSYASLLRRKSYLGLVPWLEDGVYIRSRANALYAEGFRFSLWYCQLKILKWKMLFKIVLRD